MMVAVMVIRAGNKDSEVHAEETERLDPFQTIGIPCWQSFAGPLNAPDDGYYAASEDDECGFHANGGSGRCGYCEDNE